MNQLCQEAATFQRLHADYMSQIKWNTVKFPRREEGQGWTKETMRTTCVIALWCWLNGYTFAVEVKMRLGLPRRADIVIPELLGSQVVEIMDSESNASLKEKVDAYAHEGLTCIGVPANNPAEAIKRIKKANGLE